MSQATALEASYLVFIEFLMLSKQRVVELGADHDLTSMQTLMLFLLDKPRPMHNFKRIFNCDASNVTGLVDGLEQKELASRYEDKKDRRIKMVKLEPRGRRMRAALLRKLTKRQSPILSNLTEDEFQTFIALLRKITAGSDLG
jgi:DNA-binding MarR family transcriptional regulator